MRLYERLSNLSNNYIRFGSYRSLGIVASTFLALAFVGWWLALTLPVLSTALAALDVLLSLYMFNVITTAGLYGGRLFDYLLDTQKNNITDEPERQPSKNKWLIAALAAMGLGIGILAIAYTSTVSAQFSGLPNELLMTLFLLNVCSLAISFGSRYFDPSRPKLMQTYIKWGTGIAGVVCAVTMGIAAAYHTGPIQLFEQLASTHHGTVGLLMGSIGPIPGLAFAISCFLVFGASAGDYLFKIKCYWLYGQDDAILGYRDLAQGESFADLKSNLEGRTGPNSLNSNEQEAALFFANNYRECQGAFYGFLVGIPMAVVVSLLLLPLDGASFPLFGLSLAVSMTALFGMAALMSHFCTLWDDQFVPAQAGGGHVPGGGIYNQPPFPPPGQPKQQVVKEPAVVPNPPATLQPAPQDFSSPSGFFAPPTGTDSNPPSGHTRVWVKRGRSHSQSSVETECSVDDVNLHDSHSTSKLGTDNT